MAEGPSRRGGHLPGPRRCLRRGSPGRRAGRDPGRRSLAPVAQPGRIRREDGNQAPRLPEGAARRRAAGDEDTPAVPDGSLDVCGRERQMARRTRERYAEIRQRLDAGQPEAAIRRATGLDRRTVQKYARAASADELVAGMSRESRLDEFKPYICQRWNQGLTDASQIHAELRQRGWTGSPQTVRRYVHLLRQAGPAVTPAPAVPKTREITRWLLSRPGSLDDGDQARLAAVRAGCPHLDALAGHIRDFAGMMTRRQGLLALEDWLTPGRGRRPARTPLPRRRHPTRPGGRHRRPGPALPLRRHGGKRQQDQDDQTPDVRPRWLRPPP